MTVLSVGYPSFPVGSWSGGGAEQILHLLESRLVESGVRSFVIAARGSCVRGTLIETSTCEGLQTEAARKEAQAEHREAINRVLETQEIDIIHYHGLDFNRYWAQESTIAQVATLHLPANWYQPEALGRSSVSLVCVSHIQAATVQALNAVSVVPNGIAVENFRFSSVKSNSLLWLGRLCPEKGVDHALRVARKLDLALNVAGPVHPFASHRRYFEEEVKPLLDDQRQYIGPVNLAEKALLLTRARCLLVPSLAPETSSLVAMEAASSGTPVVAYRSGALPEIVENGVSGFVVESESAMAESVLQTHLISSERCRALAEARFSAAKMVQSYLDLYKALTFARPSA
jgi:glycosyltransferase involved in cell wall biosynthesis